MACYKLVEGYRKVRLTACRQCYGKCPGNLAKACRIYLGCVWHMDIGIKKGMDAAPQDKRVSHAFEGVCVWEKRDTLRIGIAHSDPLLLSVASGTNTRASLETSE